MKSFGVCLWLLATLGLGAACSDVVAAGCVSDTECKGERVCSEGVCRGADNTLRDHPYFGQFVWEELDTSLSGYSPFPGPARGAFRLRVFLMADGTATVFYEEGFLGHGFNPYHSSESPGSGYGDEPDTRTRIDASWRVDGEEIVVGDLLRCDGEDMQERVGLACVMERAVVRDDAAGVSVTLVPYYEASAVGDAEFAAFERE